MIRLENLSRHYRTGTEVVAALESQGYDGWYVMETDVMLPGEPAEGEGPGQGVARSLAYLRTLELA